MTMHFHTIMFFICFLHLLTIPSHLCYNYTSSSRGPKGGFSLKLIPRDSIESPLHPKNITENQRMLRYVVWSTKRASYLVSMNVNNATPMDEINEVIRPPVMSDGDYYYMVQVGIGTPVQRTYLLLDTAATLSWTQCLPCESCYPQKKPIYNSIASSTFQEINCNHQLCSHDIFKCIHNKCFYTIFYGDVPTSKTSGVGITETLSFVSSERRNFKINNIVIGCSKKSEAFTFAYGKIGGILGLGPTPHSLVGQLGEMTGKKFSYCLGKGHKISSWLRFGSDIVVRSQHQIKKTPFVRLSTFYGLILKDISIAGKAIGYPRGTFEPRAGGQGGCFIDSGAPFTIIEQPAYDTFIKAFENFFAPTKLVRNIKDCAQMKNFCYYTRGIREYPSVTFHFAEEADYVVPKDDIIWIDPTDEFFMLTIVPGATTILGAWQQQDVRLIYDVGQGYLSFVPEDCNNDLN